MAPLYSFDPDTSGPAGGPGTMVISITCAEWRCGECAEWFRCDHQCHRRQGGHTTPSLADLNAAAEQKFPPEAFAPEVP